MRGGGGIIYGFRGFSMAKKRAKILGAYIRDGRNECVEGGKSIWYYLRNQQAKYFHIEYSS